MTEEQKEPTEEPSEESKAAEIAGESDPLATTREELTRLKDVLMRTAADFDNFRKRSRREIEDARKGGREELLKELLPVFDNLERAIASAQRASDIKSMA